MAWFSVLIDRIESDGSDLKYWAATFFGIIFARNLLEGSLELGNFILEPADFFVNYTLFYILVFLSLLLLLNRLTREQPAKIAKVLTVFFLLILMVPVIDFVASSGEGYRLRYLAGDPAYLSDSLLTYYGNGATIGQRVEGIAFASLLIGYLFLKTKNALKVVVGLISSYLIIFALAASPLLVYSVSNIFFGSPIAMEYDAAGRLTESSYGILRDYISHQVLAVFMLFFILAELLIILRTADKKRFSTLMRLLRPIRTLHYVLVGFFGLLLGHLATGGMEFRLYDYLFPLSFLLSIALMYQFASIANDLFDRDSQDRTGVKLSKSDSKTLRNIAMVFLSASLVLTYPLHYEVTILLVTSAFLAFLYSAPPLRLKKYPLVSSFVLANCVLLVALGGFAVFAGNLTVNLFPPEIALLILVSYTLGMNYKDLKDVESDAKNKIYSIPVILGRERGKIVVSAMVVASFVLVPFVLKMPGLIPLAITAAVLSVVFIIKDLGERYLRVMHLAFLGVVLYFILALGV